MLLAVMVVPPISAMAVEAKEEQSVVDALNKVTGLYADVYVISDATADLVNQETDNTGNVVYTVDLSFKRTLKETDATQIPAIQGMLEAKDKLEDPTEILAAGRYIDSRIADMKNNYIGVAQDTSVTVRVTLPAILPRSVSLRNIITADTIGVESGLGEGMCDTLEGIAPRSAADQMKSGNELIAEVASEASSSSLRATPHNSVLLNYDRIKARDYARNWSCTKGTIGSHSSCHNPNYTYFERGLVGQIVQTLFRSASMRAVYPRTTHGNPIPLLGQQQEITVEAFVSML